MAIRRKIIGAAYRSVLKPLLFRQDPEKIHDRFTWIGQKLGKTKLTQFITRKSFAYKSPKLEQTLHGIHFKNPVGLSAGFDKDANLISILDDVGFGYMQIGSITTKSYGGNPGTRLYRLPKSKGLIVYYGLKNDGADKIIKKIQKSKEPDFPISISIAKTNCDSTANTKGGLSDYYECIEKLEKAQIGDLYTINISCPNTFGGEPFTTPEKLDKLLTKLDKLQIKKPVFVKMPLDLKWKDFSELLNTIIDHKLAGVIIANLSKVRDPKLIRDEIPDNIQGSISGKPAWAKSNELISQTYKHYHKKLTIIGVGGIFSAEDAYEKIKRGASLVQLITGMIFQGPQLIGEINEGLVRLLEEDGYSNISQAIGTYHQ